jgi:hypothetical protein
VVSRVKIYVEGGGNSKELRFRCRAGFAKLLGRAGFSGRMPRIVACGSRNATFDRFSTAMVGPPSAGHPIMLVDSEDPVTEPPWEHLNLRDRWARPEGASDDQAQLMVTCMETWIMADREALRSCFGSSLQESALLPECNLEKRTRDKVQHALQHASRNCGRGRKYSKGRRSFQVLEKLNPDTLLQHLPYFQRFIETLQDCLPPV